MLTDEEIINIRDEFLPSQGEAFDSIAYARAILRAGAKRERERCAKVCEQISKKPWGGSEAVVCAAAIRALRDGDE